MYKASSFSAKQKQVTYSHQLFFRYLFQFHLFYKKQTQLTTNNESCFPQFFPWFFSVWAVEKKNWSQTGFLLFASWKRNHNKNCRFGIRFLVVSVNNVILAAFFHNIKIENQFRAKLKTSFCIVDLVIQNMYLVLIAF